MVALNVRAVAGPGCLIVPCLQPVDKQWPLLLPCSRGAPRRDRGVCSRRGGVTHWLTFWAAGALPADPTPHKQTTAQQACLQPAACVTAHLLTHIFPAPRLRSCSYAFDALLTAPDLFLL